MRIKLLAILALSILTVFALACGDDDDDGGDDTGGDATTAAAATTPPSNNTNTLNIAIADFSFDPSEFSVAADTDIPMTLVNDGSASHTFTVYTDAEYAEAQGIAVELDGGASQNVTGNFPAGEYFFRCEFHPTQMQGTFTAE